jgi:hypothetical protein
MTTFEIIIDGRIKCRGSVDTDTFTVINASDTTKTMTAPVHQLFPFVQDAMGIPSAVLASTLNTPSTDPTSVRKGILWTTTDDRRHLAEIDTRDGLLFSVRKHDGHETVTAIHPREFWAAICCVLVA